MEKCFLPLSDRKLITEPQSRAGIRIREKHFTLLRTRELRQCFLGIGNIIIKLVKLSPGGIQ